MPVTVALADADHGDLRPDDIEHLREPLIGTPMMSDLQHIDIAEPPVRNDLAEHITLGVAGQQGAERPPPDEHHDARLVGRGVSHLLARPYDLHADRAYLEAITRLDGCRLPRPPELLHAVRRHTSRADHS